jgi:hypothetical protein
MIDCYRSSLRQFIAERSETKIAAKMYLYEYYLRTQCPGIHLSSSAEHVQFFYHKERKQPFHSHIHIHIHTHTHTPPSANT